MSTELSLLEEDKQCGRVETKEETYKQRAKEENENIMIKKTNNVTYENVREYDL